MFYNNICSVKILIMSFPLAVFLDNTVARSLPSRLIYRADTWHTFNIYPSRAGLGAES